jgi:hypothetical protein
MRKQGRKHKELPIGLKGLRVTKGQITLTPRSLPVRRLNITVSLSWIRFTFSRSVSACSRGKESTWLTRCETAAKWCFCG